MRPRRRVTAPPAPIGTARPRETGFTDLTSGFDLDRAEVADYPAPDDPLNAEMDRIIAFHRRLGAG